MTQTQMPYLSESEIETAQAKFIELSNLLIALGQDDLVDALDNLSDDLGERGFPSLADLPILHSHLREGDTL